MKASYQPMPTNTHYTEQIKELVTKKYYPYRSETTDLFLNYFLNTFKGIEIIFTYGSTLSSRMATNSSYPDFYIIVNNYMRFYKSRVHAALNNIVPPNSYFLKIEKNGVIMPSKYCVIDMKGFRDAADAKKTNDLYIAGRLTKRIGIMYVKNEQVLLDLIENIYNALHFNVMLALSDINGKEFTMDEFILTLLGLSYRAEIRTETPDKILSIYESEPDFYKTIYTMLLEQEINNNTVKKSGGKYEVINAYFSKQYVKGFISRGRRRAVYRWPKGVYTFKNYVDYLETKIERTTGEKLNLTKWDHRFPLIFGWRHLFKLLKKKAIK